MDQARPTISATDPRLLPHETNGQLLRLLWSLAWPVCVEQALHSLVGINDTYLANKLPSGAADAGAAVGTITYFLWFFGLLTNSIGTGSTAIIARAKGARHKSVANSVCGQSMTAAVVMGCIVGLVLFLFAPQVILFTGLRGAAPGYAESYLRMLSVTLPFTTAMFIANSCLRGAGDTLTPAIVMVIVDIINMVFSFALTRGWWGLPVMGFNGIALGTIIAYICGGLVNFLVLTSGRGKIRLYWHRLRPHWTTIKRLLRIGIPAGVEGFLGWLANFGVIFVINQLDSTNVMSAAHMNTIRLESLSFLPGMAFGSAAATMVGMSLGMKNPIRAMRSALIAFLCGGGFMTLCGLCFIYFGEYPARWISSDDPRVIDLTRMCLYITGFIQTGFAAAVIFGGALRGAGDTFMVMLLSLATIMTIRLGGVMLVGKVYHRGLDAIWIVLAGELFLRGCLMFARFMHGGWQKLKV